MSSNATGLVIRKRQRIEVEYDINDDQMVSDDFMEADHTESQSKDNDRYSSDRDWNVAGSEDEDECYDSSLLAYAQLRTMRAEQIRTTREQREAAECARTGQPLEKRKKQSPENATDGTEIGEYILRVSSVISV